MGFKINIIKRRKKMDLLNYCTDKNKVYIYGTGDGSMGVAEFIETFASKKISGYVVSDGYAHAESLNGFPIYECKELPYSGKDNDCILISTDDDFYNVIISNLQKYHYENIYCISRKERRICRAGFILSEHGIDITSPVIEITKGWTTLGIKSFINEPDDLGWLYPYAFETEDFVLPYLKEFKYSKEGPYEYQKYILKKGDIVLDCGANYGFFSTKAASAGCLVYAFEPQPEVIKYLNRAKELYSNAIKIVKKAVSDKNGIVQMSVDHINTAASSIAKEKFDAKNIEVETITIDDFVEQENISRVDFIKADIEGAERQMIQGMQNVLKKFAPKLALCTYHNPDDIEIMTNLILKANPHYKIVYAWKKLYAWVE